MKNPVVCLSQFTLQQPGYPQIATTPWEANGQVIPYQVAPRGGSLGTGSAIHYYENQTLSGSLVSGVGPRYFRLRILRRRSPYSRHRGGHEHEGQFEHQQYASEQSDTES